MKETRIKRSSSPCAPSIRSKGARNAAYARTARCLARQQPLALAKKNRPRLHSLYLFGEHTLVRVSVHAQAIPNHKRFEKQQWGVGVHRLLQFRNCEMGGGMLACMVLILWHYQSLSRHQNLVEYKTVTPVSQNSFVTWNWIGARIGKCLKTIEHLRCPETWKVDRVQTP